MDNKDKRLIEHGFPCHQVGAETQRERGASSALPPLYYLHVWWARRPLTPSRAAILASLLPADSDPALFVRSLGIEKVEALINGIPWTLTGKLIERLEHDVSGGEFLPVDGVVLRALAKEDERRAENRKIIMTLKAKDLSLENDPVLLRWEEESEPLPKPFPHEGEKLEIQRVMGDPAWYKQLLNIAGKNGQRIPNLYGYDRAFNKVVKPNCSDITVLDPTAGGGSIPFEALRLGYNVIANDLNPTATVIQYATLYYPIRYGSTLSPKIEKWGKILLNNLDDSLSNYFSRRGQLSSKEYNITAANLDSSVELPSEFRLEDVTTFLFTRQVTCPHCNGEAPLLNSCWLSKEAGDQWGVRIITDGEKEGGKVKFETYRAVDGKGPDGEDPDIATVNGGIGSCVHCRQAISSDEIKTQARGENVYGKWKDRLYCVVAKRLEPKLDKNGEVVRFKSGKQKGNIKTRKVRFFRPPNERDLQALDDAEKRLKEKWPEWEAEGLIPTENIPLAHKTCEPLRFGMTRWCDMFTPRQLLGHVTMIEGLNKLKPQIIDELGMEKGKAVITYLQFAIDKGVDYNCGLSTWENTRCIVKHVFARHDFSLTWTFGEMIFSGSNSGAAWGLSQVIDAYSGIAALLEPLNTKNAPEDTLQLRILNNTAAHMPDVLEKSVDLVCIDPPYYNNVQYAELSDYFYVWQKRTLKDLYPKIFNRRLTNKKDEAVANPFRDGSTKNAKETYERMMTEIFVECRRVLKDEGLMILMFTHKSQEAWEALICSMINSGWVVTSSIPVESEAAESIHQKNIAAAASAIFISCRKRETEQKTPSMWTGLGGQGVQHKIRKTVEQSLSEFKPLRLNPVDQMVACYGRALHVLSEKWPVIDGDELVSPIRAMNEASQVVAENEIKKITDGRLTVDDLDTETAMTLIFFGIWGLNEFAYDEALNISKSLNIAIVGRDGGYRVENGTIGISQDTRARKGRNRNTAFEGFHAPIVRNGSKLRIAAPDERNENRLRNPATDWDIVYGMIMEFRMGDIPRVRPFFEKHGEGHKQKILDILTVWSVECDDQNLKKEAESILFGLK